MKSYKVKLTDGKSIFVTSVEKITLKKLSSNFISFNLASGNDVKVFINVNHIISIEEHKIEKVNRELRTKDMVENKGLNIL